MQEDFSNSFCIFKRVEFERKIRRPFISFVWRRILSILPSHKEVLLFLSKGNIRKYIPTGEDDDPGLKSPGQNLVPKTIPMIRQKDNLGSVQVHYSRRIRRITLERFLASKIAYRVEEICFQEIIILYDNLLMCQDLAIKNPGFSRKFGNSLEELTKILKSFRFNERNFLKTSRKLSLRLKSLENFLIPERNLQGVGKHFVGKVHVRPSSSTGTDKRYLPPVKFVGKGYRDKGTLRNRAKDGSPSWQELSSILPLKTLEELLED